MCRLCCPLEASAFAAEVFLDGEQVGSTAIPHLCGKARWPPTRPGFQWGFPHGFHCEALFPTVTFQNVTLLGLSSWRMLVIHVSEKLEVQPYSLGIKRMGRISPCCLAGNDSLFLFLHLQEFFLWTVGQSVVPQLLRSRWTLMESRFHTRVLKQLYNRPDYTYIYNYMYIYIYQISRQKAAWPQKSWFM